jgi:acyl carrier protein
MMKNTLETVCEILARKYSLPIGSITAGATLESLNLDSLDLIETLFEVEDEFHIRVPQDRGEDVTIVTVQDIVDVVNRLVLQQHPAQLAGGRRP